MTEFLFLALVGLAVAVIRISLRFADRDEIERLAGRVNSLESELEALRAIPPSERETLEPSEEPVPAPRPMRPTPEAPSFVPPPKPVAPPPPPPISAAPLPAAPSLTADLPHVPPSSPTAAVGNREFDWESLVGIKLFSWIAAIALVLAGVFFLRYSIEHGWLGAGVRMAIGISVGIGLLMVCELRVARNYAVTANAMDGAGIAILFSTIYAAHSLWGLLPAGPTFPLLVLIAAVAVLLSIRRDSVFIALLGLVGGFSTPALLSTGEDRPIGLFGYLLLLNLGLGIAGYRKGWPLLGLLSLAATTFYQWAWVIRFLTTGHIPLATAVFLIFPLAAYVVLGFARRRADAGKTAPPDQFERTAAIGATLPLVFALYLGATPAYGESWALLFGFLLIIDLGLAAIAVTRGPELLYSVGAASTLLVTGAWLATSYRSAAWPWLFAFISAFYALYLGAPFLLRRLRRPLEAEGVYGIFAAPLLLAAFPAVIALEPCSASGFLPFGLLFLLVAAAAAAALALERGTLYGIAAGLALTAEAAWTGRYFSSSRQLEALGLYAVFALLFLAVPVVARRLGRLLQPEALGYLALTGHLFLLGVVAESRAALEAGSLLGTLALLDLTIGAAALYLGRGGLWTGALVASDVVLALWLVSGGSGESMTGLRAALPLAAAGSVWVLLARTCSAELRGFWVAAAAAVFGGQLVVAVAGGRVGAPDAVTLALAHLVLIGLLAHVAWRTRWHVLMAWDVGAVALAMAVWRGVHSDAAAWRQELTLAATAYVAFLSYPLLLGRRAGSSCAPYLAGVLAGVAFFFFARDAVLAGGYGDYIGALPVAEALLTGLLLLRLLRIEPAGERVLGRLALVAGATMGFVTVAIPLQLEKNWITIGWALEGAALTWLYTRISHRGLLYSSLGLLSAVWVRLALNPAVLEYAPRGDVRIWNWYLYTYMTAAAAILIAARILARTDDRLWPGMPRASALLAAGAAVLLFLLLNIEIADYYSVGPSIVFNFSAGLAQDLTYTLGWALFAVGLLITGIALRSRPARIAALALLVVTILKCFLHDLARLGGLYRVGSFVGLAICLALVALVLQRFVLQSAREGR